MSRTLEETLGPMRVSLAEFAPGWLRDEHDGISAIALATAEQLLYQLPKHIATDGFHCYPYAMGDLVIEWAAGEDYLTVAITVAGSLSGTVFHAINNHMAAKSFTFQEAVDFIVKHHPYLDDNRIVPA